MPTPHVALSVRVPAGVYSCFAQLVVLSAEDVRERTRALRWSLKRHLLQEGFAGWPASDEMTCVYRLGKSHGALEGGKIRANTVPKVCVAAAALV